MQVEYELTLEDVAVFQRYHRQHPPIRPRRQQNALAWFFYFIGSLTLILMAACGLVQGSLRVTLLSVVPACGLGAFLALSAFTRYSALMAPLNERKALQEGRNAEKVLGRRRCRIDAQGIHIASEFFSLTYWWRGIDAIVGTDEYAFFYVATATAYIVPLRAFADGRTFDAFVETAKRYWDMAGVPAVVREVISEGEPWTRQEPTGLLPSTQPGDSADEGIVRGESDLA